MTIEQLPQNMKDQNGFDNSRLDEVVSPKKEELPEVLPAKTEKNGVSVDHNVTPEEFERNFEKYFPTKEEQNAVRRLSENEQLILAGQKKVEHRQRNQQARAVNKAASISSTESSTEPSEEENLKLRNLKDMRMALGQPDKDVYEQRVKKNWFSTFLGKFSNRQASQGFSTETLGKEKLADIKRAAEITHEARRSENAIPNPNVLPPGIPQEIPTRKERAIKSPVNYPEPKPLPDEVFKGVPLYIKNEQEFRLANLRKELMRDTNERDRVEQTVSPKSPEDNVEKKRGDISYPQSKILSPEEMISLYGNKDFEVQKKQRRFTGSNSSLPAPDREKIAQLLNQLEKDSTVKENQEKTLVKQEKVRKDIASLTETTPKNVAVNEVKSAPSFLGRAAKLIAGFFNTPRLAEQENIVQRIKEHPQPSVQKTEDTQIAIATSAGMKEQPRFEAQKTITDRSVESTENSTATVEQKPEFKVGADFPITEEQTPESVHSVAPAGTNASFGPEKIPARFAVGTQNFQVKNSAPEIALDPTIPVLHKRKEESVSPKAEPAFTAGDSKMRSDYEMKEVVSPKKKESVPPKKDPATYAIRDTKNDPVRPKATFVASKNFTVLNKSEESETKENKSIRVKAKAAVSNVEAETNANLPEAFGNPRKVEQPKASSPKSSNLEIKTKIAKEKPPVNNVEAPKQTPKTEKKVKQKSSEKPVEQIEAEDQVTERILSILDSAKKHSIGAVIIELDSLYSMGKIGSYSGETSKKFIIDHLEDMLRIREMQSSPEDKKKDEKTTIIMKKFIKYQKERGAK